MDWALPSFQILQAMHFDFPFLQFCLSTLDCDSMLLSKDKTQQNKSSPNSKRRREGSYCSSTFIEFDFCNEIRQLILVMLCFNFFFFKGTTIDTSVSSPCRRHASAAEHSACRFHSAGWDSEDFFRIFLPFCSHYSSCRRCRRPHHPPQPGTALWPPCAHCLMFFEK